MSATMNSQANSTFNAVLEVDHDANHDFTIGENDHYSTTTSASSSQKQFRHANGRRYHGSNEDAYFLPNDEVEAKRLDLQHYTWKITFDDPFGRIRITDKMKNVLDVGTGTGIWAIELAEAYPNINVLGTDLSPIQPDSKPSNCQFVVANAEDDWAFDTKFDYIHTRMLTVGMHDWPRFFSQCFDALEPGGWLDTYEVHFPPLRAREDPPRDSHFIRWGEDIYEAAAKAGINARASEDFTQLLAAQGFVNVERVDVQWPVGQWAKGTKSKHIGKLVRENMRQAIPAIAMAFWTRHLGRTKEEVDAECDLVLKEMDDPSSHFYFNMVLHVAQKPLEQ